jgi:hypothetical protein
MIIDLTWRRQNCLANCGVPVKRARDAWVEFLGTASGSWLCAQMSANQMQSDPLPPPQDEKVIILGVAHKSCFHQALELLRRGVATISNQSPEVHLEWGDHLPRFDFGAPATPFECPFCQYMQAAFTNEDITPSWMIRYILRRADLDAEQSRLLKRHLTVLTPVCRDCNNTWMSTLENDVQDILVPMFEQTRILSQQEQALLARWAAMKAILFDRAQEKSIVPRGFGYDLKLSKQPHEGTKVWIAAFSDGYFPKPELRPIFGPEGTAASVTPIGLCATFVMIRVVFQVLITFVPGDLASLETFGGNIEQLWPSSSDDLSWPPSYYFDCTSFPALSARINDNRQNVRMEVTLKRVNRAKGGAGAPKDSDKA